MDLIYKNFVQETLAPNGALTDIQFVYPENFNYAYDVLDALAEKCPDKCALLWVSEHREPARRFTFRDISILSAQAAHYLKTLGIEKGDRVVLILRRNYQFWFAMMALHRIGAVAIPATDQLKVKDLVYRFNAAGVKAVICTCHGEARDLVDASHPQCPELTLKLFAGVPEEGEPKEGWLSLDEGMKGQPEVFERPSGKDEVKAEDIMLMYFTSGTSGYPKIAMHDFTYPLGHIVTARYWHNVDPEGIHLTVSDTGWGKAVWGKLYGQWLNETCVFVYDYNRFAAHDLLSLMQEYKISTFCAPPTIYRFLIQEDLSAYDLSCVKYATIAGEALNPEVYNRFLEKTGVKLMEGFGQTETTLTVFNMVHSTPKPGSMGKPSPQYRVMLVDDQGKPVKTGEVGEITLDTTHGRPIGMFRGYYRDAAKTAEAWHDGLYHTGDMAWRDEDGYMWYVGRGDDLIKSSGYRIGPFEVESVLMEHPAVLECAVTAVPDPLRGQAVKATIVLTKNYSPSEELKKELQNYVKKQTAPYKYPRVVEFVEELPKTISGKIRRVQLRE